MRMCAANVEGFAYLCFFDDGSWFQVKIFGVWGCTEISPRSVKRRQFSLYLAILKLNFSLVSRNWIGADGIIPRVTLFL